MTNIITTVYKTVKLLYTIIMVSDGSIIDFTLFKLTATIFLSVFFTAHLTDIWVCTVYLYLINVCIISVLYFEYGPSLSSVVGLK